MNIHKTPRFRLLASFVIMAFLAAGCASQTGNTVSSGQARTAQTVSFGTITHLAPAFIEDNASGLGTAGGAVVGGVAGSTMGRGQGRVLTTLGGAVIGGLLGTGIERSVNSRDGIEITVRLENGQTVSVVQELGAEERGMAVGDRVRVMHGADGSARVRR